MAKLVFLNADVIRMLEHNPGLKNVSLVKDEGIYIMGKGTKNPKSGSPHVAYAKGYNPHKADVYDKCRNAVGGDDFVEQFKWDAQMQEYIVIKHWDLEINITKSQFAINLIKPNK